jgi:hypothetical protein
VAGFTAGGLKLKSSIASTMVKMLPATAPAGPWVAGIIAAIAFVAEVIEWMSGDDTEQALKKIEEAINHIIVVLAELDRRLDELINEMAIESNRQTLRDLKDYLDEVLAMESQLRNLSPDVNVAVTLADQAGIIADKFLRDDYEIWRWTDVVESSDNLDMVLLQFKSMPTLPVYVVAVTTWLVARERAVGLGGRDRLAEDGQRVQRHLRALTIRPVFNRYEPEQFYPDGTLKSTPNPESLPEHLQWHIRTHIGASTRYPENGICHFFFTVQNWMTGDEEYGGTFERVMESNNVLCTVESSSVASPETESVMEEAAGTAAMEELRKTLERVSVTGTMRTPFIDRFPNVMYYKSSYWGVNAPGELVWFEHVWHSGQPGAPAPLTGPRRLAVGWNGYRTVLPAGDKCIYGVLPDGTLHWFRHEGAFDGGAVLIGPVAVSSGWNTYEKIIGGGNGVIYGMRTDGRLFWYRHDGFETGTRTWRGPAEVGSGWTAFQRIFSAGNGTLYGIRPDGTLVWHFHHGWLDGTAIWEQPMEVGTGWGDFAHVFGTAEGIIYAASSDGRLLWYEHETWKNGGEIHFIIIGGRRQPTSMVPVPYWKGPVVVADAIGRYSHLVGVMPKPFNPGDIR